MSAASSLSGQFDAIVVGSGITGGWAAKELTEAGLKVLLLERGRNVVHGVDYPTEHIPAWQLPFRGEGDAARYRRDYPVQSTHFLFNEYAEHFFVNDREHPYVSDPEHPYSWYRGYQVGGRSLIWGRQVYRWSDLDFAANAKDGHGVDWPIRYADLAPWYDYVEDFIGVSGERLGLPQLPDGKFMPPMELNCAEALFKRKVETAFKDRKVTIGRAAVLTQPHRGRGACHYCGPCERGCSVGAYFSTQSSTLPAATATGNLTLLPNQIVAQVKYDPKSRRAVGVETIDAQTRQHATYSGRLIFLCASTLGSTQILLNSRSESFPGGLGGSSGALGHYFMDQAYGLSLVARTQELKANYYYGNRPNGIYVPRFRNLGDQPQQDYVRGFAYQGRAWRPGWNRGKTLPGFGAAFKQELRKPGPWLLALVASVECLPRFENAVALDERKRDQWGIPQLRIRLAYGSNEARAQVDAQQQAQAMAQVAGFEILRSSSDIMPAGVAIHEMGTARMGADPKDSVLNAHNQVHEVANLFVTDGACMASSACQNPSLTYMALTARACRYAVDQVKLGRI